MQCKNYNIILCIPITYYLFSVYNLIVDETMPHIFAKIIYKNYEKNTYRNYLRLETLTPVKTKIKSISTNTIYYRYCIYNYVIG